MASDPTGPPGLTRPKTTSSSSLISPLPSAPGSKPPHIFSPAPSQPRSSWFQLLSSPSPPPAPLLASPPVAFTEINPSTLCSWLQASTHLLPSPFSTSLELVSASLLCLLLSSSPFLIVCFLPSSSHPPAIFPFIYTPTLFLCLLSLSSGHGLLSGASTWPH